MLDLIESYNLCDDIRNMIYEYLPNNVLIWTKREKYTKYHHCLQDILESKRMYENYLRYVIRNDFDIIFEIIINTHDISSWKNKKYVFRNVKYSNYLHFLDCFMFDNNAHKCRSILFTNVYKKKYKKIQRNIAWSN